MYRGLGFMGNGPSWMFSEKNVINFRVTILFSFLQRELNFDKLTRTPQIGMRGLTFPNRHAVGHILPLPNSRTNRRSETGEAAIERP